jgi:hypothetical protein
MKCMDAILYVDLTVLRPELKIVPASIKYLHETIE